ncbi:MAG: hypothetical protein IPH78_01270 [Bacteroidetes bacterium]|nr:hypothetical protein [Bacteroidota bacterium]
MNELKSETNELQETITYCQQQNDIRFLNLYPYYFEVKHRQGEDVLHTYYWPIEGHCTPIGYSLVAQKVFEFTLTDTSSNNR